MKKLVEGLLRPGESPKTQSVRKRLGTAGSCVGVGVNAALAAGKLIAGTLTGSVAIMADAVNNLSDAAGSIVSLVSMRLAQKPVDREHPFGHGRAEYLGALVVGVLILVMGVEMLMSGIRAIQTPAPMTVTAATMIVLMVSVLLKFCLYRFYHELGTLIDFSSLLAASKDSFSDMLATAAVALSMVVWLIWDIPADGVMGTLVSLLVLKAGFDVVRDTVDSLMGGRPDPELGREIIRRLMAYEDILGTHDLLLHDYGPGRCIASIHAEVPAEGDLLHLHEIIDRAEHEIGEALNIPICIHMDPIVTGDEETDRVHDHLMRTLQEIDPQLMLHDLRKVPGEKQTNLVFDVVIPPGDKRTKEIGIALRKAAWELDPRYVCVIRFDIDYYH